MKYYPYPQTPYSSALFSKSHPHSKDLIQSLVYVCPCLSSLPQICSTVAEAMEADFHCLLRALKSCHEEGVGITLAPSTLGLVFGRWALSTCTPACLFPNQLHVVPLLLVYSPSTIKNEILLWISAWFGTYLH